MRYRIDGVLYEMMPPPAHIALAISSRIKVMANLDIAEHRMPQDGRIELSVNNQPIDLRVSVLPTMFGESVVMRVLDRANVSLDLDKIGMREDDLTIDPPAHPQAQRHRASSPAPPALEKPPRFIPPSARSTTPPANSSPPRTPSNTTSTASSSAKSSPTSR